MGVKFNLAAEPDVQEKPEPEVPLALVFGTVVGDLPKKKEKKYVQLVHPKGAEPGARLFAVTHDFKYGRTLSIISIDATHEEMIDLTVDDGGAALAALMGLDFEPDKEEFISVEELDIDVRVLSKSDIQVVEDA